MKKLPNILWIFSDQHRAHAMSCSGDENIHTPHLDKLAEEGIRFTRAYANTPLCAPVRATLYTGKYIHNHGAVSLHIPPHPGQRMLAEELSDYGYHTSHMGKWHISGGGSCSFVSPYFRPGWNDWLGWETHNIMWDTPYTYGRGMKKGKLEGYQTDALANLTIDWIKQQPEDRPWFHVVSIEPPHPPNVAPEEYMDRFKHQDLKLRPNVRKDDPNLAKYEKDLRGYYAQISNLDDNVGKIMNTLEETGKLENTIVFYFSDHGDLMGSHEMTGKRRPEQESSNIPLIVRYPKRIPAGRVSEKLISIVDIFPTVLGIIGAAVPEYTEGTDLSGLLIGESESGADSVLLQFEHPFFDETPEQAYRAIIKDVWVYTHYLTEGPTHLFNLSEDPYQLNNRIEDSTCTDQLLDMKENLRIKLLTHGDDFLERSQLYFSGNT